MKKNEQLTFSDDHLLPRLNEIYLAIENGEFSEAIKLTDNFLKKNSDYPGINEAYRTARFWENRQQEIAVLSSGKETADFYMNQWEKFNNYADEKKIKKSSVYKSIQKFIFFTAANNYKIAFQKQQSPTDNFELLLNLGICFLTLKEYNYVIETLEYARSAYKLNSKILAILAEAYYQTGEIPKSLFFFREAFFIDPSKIDISLISAKPISETIELIKKTRPQDIDIREWIPIIGHLSDIFYIKKNLNNQQVETIKKDIFTMEHNLQMLTDDKINSTNIKPRLINKYLWLYDYYQFQKYDFENLSEIRTRLIKIDKELFENYFKNKNKK